MMDAMMGRSDEYVFSPTELANNLSMCEEGISAMDHEYHDHHSWLKSRKREDGPKHISNNRLKRSDPCRNSVIKIFTVMMNNMRPPKNINFMTKTMIPVPHQVGSK